MPTLARKDLPHIPWELSTQVLRWHTRTYPCMWWYVASKQTYTNQKHLLVHIRRSNSKKPHFNTIQQSVGGAAVGQRHFIRELACCRLSRADHVRQTQRIVKCAIHHCMMTFLCERIDNCPQTEPVEHVGMWHMTSIPSYCINSSKISKAWMIDEQRHVRHSYWWGNHRTFFCYLIKN